MTPPPLAGQGRSAVWGMRANPGRAQQFICSFPVFFKNQGSVWGGVRGGRAGGEPMLGDPARVWGAEAGEVGRAGRLCKPPPCGECGSTASRPEMQGGEAAEGWVGPVVLDSGAEILTEGDPDVPVDRWIRGAEGVSSRGGWPCSRGLRAAAMREQGAEIREQPSRPWSPTAAEARATSRVPRDHSPAREPLNYRTLKQAWAPILARRAG